MLSAVEQELRSSLTNKEMRLIETATFDSQVVTLRPGDEGLVLSSTDVPKMNDLLAKNTDLFEAQGPPSTHHIATRDHTPIPLPPYRLGPKRLRLLQE